MQRYRNKNMFHYLQVVLVNGCWDTTNKIPNIVAEMHVNTEDFSPIQNVGIFKSTELDSRDLINGSPRSSDSGIESDCTDGNLSWLLNYKINELPPVPGKIFSMFGITFAFFIFFVILCSSTLVNLFTCFFVNILVIARGNVYHFEIVMFA